MAGRSSRSMRFHGPRRQTSWSQLLETPFALSVSVPAFSRVAFGVQPAEMGQAESSTIVRSHLALHARPFPSLETEELPWACGLIIVSEEAFQAGAVAIPSPALSQSDADWLMFQQGYTSPFGFSNEYKNTNYNFDSKAMRKVHGENKRLCFVFSNRGDVQMDMAFQSRILFKLA